MRDTLGWMVFLTGFGLGTLAWAGSWEHFGHFLLDLIAVAIQGGAAGGLLLLILQACRDG